MPVGLGGSFYYNAPPGPFGSGSSPVGQQIWEQNPDTAYYSYGRSLGIPDDNSGFARWFAQQLGHFQTGYNAYTAMNPISANIVDYANSLGGYGDWLRQYQNQDARLRGESPSDRGGGAARWVNR